MTDEPAHIHAVARLGEGVEDRVPPEKRIRGAGVARVWNAFSDAPGRFHAGQWRSEDEIRRVDYTETELCVILEGRVRLADETGAAVEFGPGEAFVIAPGFRGTWQSIGRVTKVYAILEPET